MPSNFKITNWILKLNKLRLPLAWLLLRRYPHRFWGASLSVAFAGLLIIIQLGIQSAIFESTIQIPKKFNADYVLISSRTISLNSLEGFSESSLFNLAKYSFVKEVLPIKMSFVQWRLRSEIQKRPAMAIGINPTHKIFVDQDTFAGVNQLDIAGNVIYDQLSLPQYGDVQSILRHHDKAKAFVDGQVRDIPLNIIGLARLGPSLGFNSSFLLSTDTFLQLFPRSNSLIEIGLITIDGRRRHFSDDLRSILSKDIDENLVLMTKEEFLSFEKSYWNNGKPIGYAFIFSSVMSLIVSGFMIYQMLFADVSSQLPSYSLLLSLGHPRRRIESIIFSQAFIVTSVGFPLALVLGSLLYYLISTMTALPMRMAPEIVGSALLLVLGISSSAGLIAVSKVHEADPLSLF